MFGCLRRVGCLVLLALLVLAAYVTRHRWLPAISKGRYGAVPARTWKRLTPEGARRARRAIALLDSGEGQVFGNLSVEDFAAFLLDSTSLGFTTGIRDAEAAADGDNIFLRTRLRVADFGVDNVPLLGGAADKTAVVVIGGTLAVDRPGLGEWRVKSIMVDAIEVPGPAIARVIHPWAAGMRQGMSHAGVREDAFGFGLPPQIADLRVHGGMVTLYKQYKQNQAPK